MTTLAGQSLVRHIQNRDLVGVVNFIQSAQVNLDERDEDGQSFLMIACQVGDLAIVQELLKVPEVDVNAVDNDNWSALLNASKGGYVEILQELLDHGAIIDHKDMGGWTALTWACYKGRTEVVQELLDRNANPNMKGEHHISCLTWAAGRGYTEIVKALLVAQAKVNTADKYGTTPLIWAARKGHKEIVEALLEEGANVDNAGMNSWTALTIAAKGGYSDVVECLLECDPNVNAVDKDGYTALTWAARDGHPTIVYQLLQKGAYVNLPDRLDGVAIACSGRSKRGAERCKYGDTILIHAVKGGHLQVVQALLKKYADVDVQGVDSKTALYWATEKGHPAIVKALLDYNADTEIPNKDGDTPLMKAVRARNVELVSLLLNKGAKIGAMDKKGDTSLHIAVRGRSKRIAEVLLRNPKDSRLLYRPNKAGETPYALDSTHQKSVLTQIFGARTLNAEENVQGYDLYSSTIADCLSDPQLNTPITVGLYAKWGSGKSFLINRLQKEMKGFTLHNCDSLFEFSITQFVLTALVSAMVGVILALTLNWMVGLGVGLGLILLQYIFLGVVWLGSHYKDWEWAEDVSIYLQNKQQTLDLLMQLLFCNMPPQPSRETMAVKFLFTDNARLASVVGEKSITGMIGTLFDALEEEYGLLVTRLFRVFKPGQAVEDGKFKSLCCIPYFLIVIFVLACIGTAAGLLSHFGVHSIHDEKYTVVDSVLIALGIIIGFSIIGNIVTWSQILVNMLMSPKRRVNNIASQIDVLKMEGFMQRLKKEVELMGQFTACMDNFLIQQTRLVVFVDGLDSCEQEKLLQVLDTVHLLFGDHDSPFVTVLAVDPHVVIKGIEHNLHGLFRDSSINGHDYLRNIVHLPFFLQGQSAPARKYLAAAREAAGRTGSTDNIATARYSRQDSNMSASQVSLSGRGHRRHRTSTSEAPHGLASSSIMRAGSTFDLSKAIAKDSYFSDINPRNMRRLMNIVAVTGRLLRAYELDFPWNKMAAWINITEQWPYRLSWIILEVEDHDDLDDTLSLKTVYDRVLPKIPISKEIDPLLEIDRNPRKLEIFLNNHVPVLTVKDLRMFLPCTINVDPYLRKLIREMMQNVDNAMSDFGMAMTMPANMNAMESTPAPTGSGMGWSSVRRPASRMESQPPEPQASRMTPTKRFQMPFMTPMPHHPYAYGYPPHMYGAANPMSPYHMMASYMAPPQMPQSPKYRVVIQGGDPDMPLSTWTVEEVCEVLGRLEGLNHRHLVEYRAALEENNINGMVLMYCDLAELKGNLPMGFGDWELLKAMVEYFREKELGMSETRNFRSRHPSGGRIIEEDTTPTAPPKLKNFTNEKQNQNLEVPKAHYPKSTASGTSVVDGATMTSDLSSSMGAISMKSEAESQVSQPSSIPGSPRKFRHSQDKVMKIEGTLKSKDDGLVDELIYETAAISSAVASLAPSSSSEDEDEQITVQEMLPQETTKLLQEAAAAATSSKLKRKHAQIGTSEQQEKDALTPTTTVEQALVHSDSRSTLRQLSQVQEEDMVDLLEAEELPLDDSGFLPHSSQPIEVPIKAYTDFVADYTDYLSRSAPASEYYQVAPYSLSTHGSSIQGSIQGSFSSLVDEHLMPAASWEHISVRKANQVADESGPSAFKPVTPASSAPGSRAASAVSLPHPDVTDTRLPTAMHVSELADSHGNLSRRSSRGSRLPSTGRRTSVTSDDLESQSQPELTNPAFDADERPKEVVVNVENMSAKLSVKKNDSVC